VGRLNVKSSAERDPPQDGGCGIDEIL